jgi:signal transduction histidine kinase
MGDDGDRGTLSSVLGEDGLKARSEMQVNLLRSFFWLSILAAAGLTLRESLSGTPVVAAIVALLLGLAGWALVRRSRVPLRALGFAFFCSLVLLITKAALDLGGASGSALSFSFIPGFLAVLVLGPAWGWTVCGLMLLSLAWLAATTALPLPYDRLRFIDEVAMTLFTAGLAHTLMRTFAACEAAMSKRRAELAGLHEQRQAMTLAIYEQLEPLAEGLVKAVPQRGAPPTARSAFQDMLRRLTESLSRAKVLAHRADSEQVEAEDPDQLIRRRAMRAWVRLGAVLMAFFVLRNAWAGVSFVPSLFSLGFCFMFDFWLSRPESARFLESTALALGILATGPMIAHVHAYGPTPDAPALVVMPGTVLFTALLSRGPATWAIVALNVGILAWVGLGRTLTLPQSRLLGDLALSFLVVSLALRYVFALRRRYAQALLEQGRAMAEALRQHRKLAGTLFHDVSNHLQVLSFHVEIEDSQEDLPSAESLSRRIQRLIVLSKEFLLSPAPAPTLSSVTVADTLDLLSEAFAPRLDAKRVRLDAGPGMELRVRAQPELLVESVLGNLLSNAVKFSPQGSAIVLSAELAGEEVRIVLRDSGPGLPLEILRGLEHDEALPSKLGTAGERGQGYGLQLVREHLQRMGGCLELSNRREGGTQAVVRLHVG